MLTRDAADSYLASHDDLRDELYEEEQMENHYHEASQRFLSVLWGAIGFIRDRPKQALFALDIVAHTFVHPSTADLTLDEIGYRHGKTRAAASAAALKLQRSLKMPETFAQKLKAARYEYSKSRRKKLNKK
jgi:hypothetical protein